MNDTPDVTEPTAIPVTPVEPGQLAPPFVVSVTSEGSLNIGAVLSSTVNT